MNAPPRSKARLTAAEERVRSKRVTPISITPCRSSNSTEEPSTSSRRGSTLTRTPTAFRVRTRSSTIAPSRLSGARIARCTSSACAIVRISARRCCEQPSVDQWATSSPSTKPTSSALTPRLPLSLERTRLAEAWSPMKRQRSAGAIRSATARAAARASMSSTLSASQRNIASLRSSAPATIRPPESQVTKAHSVAT